MGINDDQSAGKSHPVNGDISKHLPRKIRNGADLWASFDDIDEMLADERVDVKRAMVKVMNNRQRVDFLKLAVRAGALKQNMLALPDEILDTVGEKPRSN